MDDSVVAANAGLIETSETAATADAVALTAAAVDGSAGGAGGTPRLSLDGFTGPLERLLSLARAHQVDLTSLSLVALIDQLTTALQQAPPTTPLGAKGDWVVMAAWLLQLRSLLLLPADAPAREGAEHAADQLRARLRELRWMQALAAWLGRRPQRGRDVFARGRPELFGLALETAPAPDGIAFLWASLALFDDDLPAADATARYRPPALALYAVPEARARILRLLAATPDGRTLDTLLPDVTDAAGAANPLRRRSAWASTFIASLELARQGEVTLAQEACLKPVTVRATSAEPAPSRLDA